MTSSIAVVHVDAERREACQTRLATGAYVEKDSPVLELLGAVEELSAWVALLAADPPTVEAGRLLVLVRNDLFELERQVAAAGAALLQRDYVQRLAAAMGELERRLPPPPSGLLAGGTVQAARAGLARGVCRRAERRLIGLWEIDPALRARDAVAYLNLLGDLLQLMGRLANAAADRAPPVFDRGLSLCGEPPLG
ncbi:ATP:cob(I)alamin adenosyltransferase [Xanthobacter sp. V4C-4]|uniref:ATP:cob(I)alamin adenosyltransferase n=1 Tax=Xanthobacter cornucopiae TaxID=3119924 RepID=UPI0037272A5B